MDRAAVRAGARTPNNVEGTGHLAGPFGVHDLVRGPPRSAYPETLNVVDPLPRQRVVRT
jgi:hypothetical protein